MTNLNARASEDSYGTIAHRSRFRMAIMALVGVAVAAGVGLAGSWAYAPAMGWAAACLVYLAWVWTVVGRLDAKETAAHALREDPGRRVSDSLVLAATLASFAGVALILLDASDAKGGTKAGVIGIALGSVALSWFLVHTLFALRYAAIYYRDKKGVDFNEEKPPRYMDFAYLSFTVGMTFQVSDTNLKTDSIRGTVLRHALLAYLLGAIIVATTINLIAGLIH